MHFPSALALMVGLPTAMAAALAKPEHEADAIFKRGASCLNTNSHNNGWTNIPDQDIQGLIDQLYRIGDRQVPLYWKISGNSWTFTYTWNQAKICVKNEYVIPKNTHLKMREAAWVVDYIRGQCSSHIGDATCHGDNGLSLHAELRHVRDGC
ncbi:hypothetical protein FBEOM_14737 [Fusarium beomiforme]|uniref:Uncharacterized protein n=1 Tax=Fusarium beomiforme TaxID=44412 RepID=A0A9P5A312_9HYPO|nr:hypothetical protein FBEOM_14737 [Fusarium beomiforme]